MCAFHILSYVTKDEEEMSQMLKGSAREMHDADVKDRLKHIGSRFLDDRELSAQEAVTWSTTQEKYICNVQLVWIPTDLPGDRIRLLKPQSIIDNMDDDDTDVFATGILGKYSARPLHPEIIKNICLAQFAAWYVNSSKKEDDATIEVNDDISVHNANSQLQTSIQQMIKLADGK